MSRKLLLQNGDVGFREIAKHVRRGAHVGRRASPWPISPRGAIFDRSRLRPSPGRGTVPAISTSRQPLLTIATLLASPHTLDYDLMILGPCHRIHGLCRFLPGESAAMRSACWPRHGSCRLLSRHHRRASPVSPLVCWVLLAFIRFHSAACGAGSPGTGDQGFAASRKRDLICSGVLVRSSNAGAVRQSFSTMAGR